MRLRHIRAEDGYDALRHQARLHELTLAGCKQLCRHASALYRPPIHRDRDRATAYLDLFRYVRLLQHERCREPIPFVVMRAVFAQHWYVDELDMAESPLGLIRGTIDKFASRCRSAASSIGRAGIDGNAVTQASSGRTHFIHPAWPTLGPG